MKKGLSTIISVILVLLIAIATTTLAIIWLPKITVKIFPPIETELNNSYIRSRACLNIDNIDPVGKTITISNCGKISLSQFNFYIDGIKIDLSTGELDPQQSVKLNYLEDLTQGEHNLYATSYYAEAPVITFYVPFLVFGGAPVITWENPTPQNGGSTTNNWVYLNTTITDSYSTSAFLDWNNSLVGYWAMDWYNSTGVFDNSTYNNFGKFQGGLGTSNITSGKYGKGLAFDGSNDRVDAGNSSKFNTNKITIEAWAFPKNSGGGTEDEIVSKWSWTNDQRSWALYIDGVTGKAAFLGDVNGLPSSYFGATSTTVLQNNTWYYVVGTYDGSQIKIYVNGSLENTVSNSSGFYSSISNVSIGSSATPMYFFNGTIDEVKIYNRVLSPEEISASYNNGLYRLYHNFTSLPNGNYNYYAYAIDTQGNASKTEVRTVTVSSVVAPLWFSNSTNNTAAGKPTLFSLNWTSIPPPGLSGYIFSFDNGTGVMKNDSWKNFENQTGTALFIDNFESGDFSAWKPPYIQDGGQVPVNQSSVVHGGSYAAKFVINTSAGKGASVLVDTVNSASTTMHLRAYCMWNATSMPSGNYFYVGPTIDNNAGSYDNSAVIYNNGTAVVWGMVYRNNTASQFVYNASSSITPTANTWYSIEVMTTRGSGTGEVSMWVNGVMVIDKTGLSNDIYPDNLEDYQLGAYTNGTLSAPIALYCDDAVMDTNYIGPYNSWSNVTKTINSTANSLIRWCVYANDTLNNTNFSSCINPFSLITT